MSELDATITKLEAKWRRSKGRLGPATRRQLQVLAYIRRYIVSYYCPPAVREIGAELGITSPQGTQRHLDALVKKGLLVPVLSACGIVRGHRPTPEGEIATESFDMTPLPPPPTNADPRSLAQLRRHEARQKKIEAMLYAK